MARLRRSSTSLALGALLALAAAPAVAIGCGGDDGSKSDDAGAPPDPVGAAGEGGIDPASADGATDDATLDASDAATGPLWPGYADFDVNHVLSTGQSNSVANGGDPPLSTTQPYTNLSFDTGVMPMKTCDGEGCKAYETPASFVPLVEGDRFFDYAVETASSGLANEIGKLAAATYLFGTRAGYPKKHDVLVSLHGRSGNTYWCLRKGGCPYKVGYFKPFDQAMMEVQSAKAIAAASGRTYAVRAVTAIHGESDHYAYGTNTQEFPLDGTDGTPGSIKDYADALLEWQRDYEASVKAITGQTTPVPLIISGLSGWNDVRYSKLAQMQLDAHVRSAGKVLYATPAYPLSVRSDCLHFDDHGQRRLGEYFAKVYAKVVLGGETWEPVRPKAVTRAGNVITVKFFVPSPPLVLDTTHVTDPGHFGFDFTDGSPTSPAITDVALAGPDTVVVTLASPPAGPSPHLTYAQNQTPGTCIGPGTVFAGGARGNLRDSDGTPSQDGYDLYDWGVNFDIPVP